MSTVNQQIKRKKLLNYLHGMHYLPSHAARKRASLLALEILWGLPAAGWQLSAAGVEGI